MKLMHDCVNEITPELLYYICACGAVNGRAVATSASAVRKSLSFLPETRHHQEPSPVELEVYGRNAFSFLSQKQQAGVCAECDEPCYSLG